MNKTILVGVLFLSSAVAAEVMRPTNAAFAGAAEAEKAPAKDGATSEPAQITDATVNKVLAFIVSPDYKEERKRKANREKVRDMILAVVDMKSVAILTLADFRRKFSDEQFQQFTDTFAQLIFSTYVNHLEKYSGEKVVIGDTEKLSASRAMVKTKTVTKNKEIPVDLSFALEGKQWKLYDVRIEGVSLVKNYRSQFREILLKRSPDQFLEQLKEKVKANENGKQ